ncbi:hypothetical protein MMPV_008925 [Pyropia vietnamensis]
MAFAVPSPPPPRATGAVSPRHATTPPPIARVRRRPRAGSLVPAHRRVVATAAARSPVPGAPTPPPPQGVGGRWLNLWAWASRPASTAAPPATAPTASGGSGDGVSSGSPPPDGSTPAEPALSGTEAATAMEPALTAAAASSLSPSTDGAPPLPELQLDAVRKTFDGKPVLRGVSLSVHRGEAVGIIGPSGSGKSTLLRLIAGLDMPDAGAVRFRGWTRPARLGEEPRGAAVNPLRLGMVFQNSALFDSLSVGENVGFQLLYGGDRSTNAVRLPVERVAVLVDAALARVGLPGMADKRPSELSGGMRRRVAFARAVICDPEVEATRKDVVLIDEVTAGLDSMASTRVEDLMVAMGDECPTRVVVTHQFSTIRRTVKRVVFLHDGVLRWDGPVEELDTTDNPYVRQYFDASLSGPMKFPDDGELLPAGGVGVDTQQGGSAKEGGNGSFVAHQNGALPR